MNMQRTRMREDEARMFWRLKWVFEDRRLQFENFENTCGRWREVKNVMVVKREGARRAGHGGSFLSTYTSSKSTPVVSLLNGCQAHGE